MATLRPAHALVSFAGFSLSDSEVKERLAVMACSPVFGGVSRSDCITMAVSAKSCSFPRRELLFMEGQEVRNVLLIHSGSVKLTQVGQDGSEVILWMKARGDLASQALIRAGDIHTYSAHVVQSCTVVYWDAGKFGSFVDRIPSIRTNLNAMVSSRLTELEQRFREVATQKVEKRVANIILRLLDKVGVHESGGTAIYLSREELAQMTGTTLFSVSRLMSEWEQRGFVSPRREALVVHNVAPVQTIANNEL